MSRAILPAVVSTILISVAFAGPVQAQSVVGVWLTESRSAEVRIAPCADASYGPLCGTIVKLNDPKDQNGAPVAPDQAVDRRNPDPNLRGRKILGMVFLYGFKKGSDPNAFEGGTIYNSEDGKTYSANISLQPNGTLHLRGYAGTPMFGKTQTWTRVQ